MAKQTNRQILEEIQAGIKQLLKPVSGGHTNIGTTANPKIYASVVKFWGGTQKFAAAIRERTAGYPESKPGLIGCWKDEPEVDAFVKDYPGLF